MRSLKSRLMVGMIGSMIALLIGFDVLVYNVIARVIWSQFDGSLKSAAQLMCAAVEWDDDELDFEFDVQRTPEYIGDTTSAYYEFRRSDGDVMMKSPSPGGDESIGFMPDDHPYDYKTFRVTDGRYVRAIAVDFLPRVANTDGQTAGSNTPPSLVLTLAKSVEGILSQLRFLKYILASASAVIIGLACGVVVAVVNKTVAPLTSVAAQIEEIGEENLERRITGSNFPAEVALIQNRINSLLTRIEASFERERAFNANLAHELRTPLAGLRSIIEVTLTKEREAADYRSALAELLPIIDSMKEMSLRLLMLTKIESGQMTLNPEPLRVAQRVDKCWLPLAAKAAEAGLVFENRIAGDVVCRSDETAVSMVFSNLLDNAVEYTNRGGKVWVTAQKTKGAVEIIFENTGNQLTEDQVQRVFDCYWRGDAARSRADVHFGLGLALARRMVGILGGKIRAEVADSVFRVRVFLPAEKADFRE